MKTILGLLLALMLVTACTPATPIAPDDRAPGTQGGIVVEGTYVPAKIFDPEEFTPRRAVSEEELQAILRTDSYDGMMMEYARSATAIAAPTAMTLDSAKSESGAGFSETNNQVAGIDEADIIKTDGEYIYTVSGSTLFIVQAGEDAKVMSTTALDMQAAGLFVEGDALMVIGNLYDLDRFKDMGIVPYGGMTQVLLFDISDRESPAQAQELLFEGSYSQGRLKDGEAFIVVTSPAQSRDHPTPLIVENGQASNVAIGDVYLYPFPYDSTQFASVHKIDMQSGERVESTSVVVNWNLVVYMSEDNMYFATQESINEWEIRQEIMQDLLEGELTAKDRDLIARIKAVDDVVLSQGEKKNKIQQVYERYVQYMKSDEQEALYEEVDDAVKKRLDEYESLTYTIISRIDADSLAVAATGNVPGTLVNQFALDEHEGTLRAATTIQPRWWGPIARPMIAETAEGTSEPAQKMVVPERTESSSGVYTLDLNMRRQGELTGLAPGESIFSARFMGERLYMVTFRQVDPFFVIDLSNPAKPKQLGELKIPGFSRYLHPYSDDVIIGIGRDKPERNREIRRQQRLVPVGSRVGA
jgi:uncharacterized secreted protein with C-terminal beta-propeller domain